MSKYRTSTKIYVGANYLLSVFWTLNFAKKYWISMKILVKILDFYEILCQILDKYFLRSPVFFRKILSPKYRLQIISPYETFCQNTELLQKISQKSSILTKIFIEVQYFDKYFHRSPVFWDLEFSQKSSIFSQNSKSKIPIVDNQPLGLRKNLF